MGTIITAKLLSIIAGVGGVLGVAAGYFYSDTQMSLVGIGLVLVSINAEVYLIRKGLEE